MLWSAVHGSGAASMDVGRGRERVHSIAKFKIQNTNTQIKTHKHTKIQNTKYKKTNIHYTGAVASMNVGSSRKKVQCFAKLVNGIYTNGCANI